MDWIAAIINVAGIILLTRKMIIGWVFMLVAALLWIDHFAPKEELAFVALQLIYIGAHIYGWIRWHKDEVAEKRLGKQRNAAVVKERDTSSVDRRPVFGNLESPEKSVPITPKPKEKPDESN
ncbi:MAG: nicotinamide mononucleotide transporter [bacterium]